MRDRCQATHPDLLARCDLPADHVKPDGFDMGQWTDYSSMHPGRPHRFTAEWFDETVEDGFFKGGKVWSARNE